MEACYMNKQNQKAKAAYETSEKLAQPLTPLVSEVKSVTESYAQLTGKENWVVRHRIDIGIMIGAAWSILKLLNFFYPESIWFYCLQAFDTFFPITFTIIALFYRLYPYKKLLFSPKKDHI